MAHHHHHHMLHPPTQLHHINLLHNQFRWRTSFFVSIKLILFYISDWVAPEWLLCSCSPPLLSCWTPQSIQSSCSSHSETIHSPRPTGEERKLWTNSDESTIVECSSQLCSSQCSSSTISRTYQYCGTESIHIWWGLFEGTCLLILILHRVWWSLCEEEGAGEGSFVVRNRNCEGSSADHSLQQS